MSLATTRGGGTGGADLSDATPGAVGTAAAGTSDDASRADHVHGDVADVVTAATKGGSGKLIKSIQYSAKGRVIAAVTEGDAGTDYLAPAYDEISHQTLVGASDTITIPTLAGNSYDVIEIEGVGPVGATNTGTIAFNGGGTAVTYKGIYVEDGVASAETTYLFTSQGKNLWFKIQLFPRCTSRRMGVCNSVAVRESDTRIAEVRSAFEWPNTANEITDIVITGAGGGGNYFSVGFKVTVRKRVIGA